MHALDRGSRKLTHSLLFFFITLVFLICFGFDFRGFNGSDDLHYALLSSRMLEGKYDPFVPDDIQSGRSLLVAVQALFYRVAGISDWSTQAGTLLCIVGCCWLTLFRLARTRNNVTVIAGAAIFYFNPAIKTAALGIMPDAYVMLMMILLYLCLRAAWTETQTSAKKTGLACLSAVLCLSALFIKEVSIVFFPAVLLLTWIHGGRNARRFATIFAGVFLAGIVCAGFVYQHYTGDFFFRVTQIDLSQQMFMRLKPVENRFPDLPELLVRLTYGPWLAFLKGGYYPLLLAAGLLLFAGRKKRRTSRFGNLKPGAALTVLLLVSLYFPFAIHAYIPLPPVPRHFLFLLPFATIVITDQMTVTENRHAYALPLLCLAACLLVPLLTPAKWLWLSFGFLFAGIGGYFLSTRPGKTRLSPGTQRQTAITGTRPTLAAALLALLLCLTSMENIFLHRKKWYYDLRSMEKSMPGVTCYFPDHDNLMHWRLFRGFKDNDICPLVPHALPAFAHYYPDCNAFTPGWLIVNDVYTERPDRFLQTIAAMGESGFLPRQKKTGNVRAYLMANAVQYDSVKTLLRP